MSSLACLPCLIDNRAFGPSSTLGQVKLTLQFNLFSALTKFVSIKSSPNHVDLYSSLHFLR